MSRSIFNHFDLDPERYFELARPMLSPNGRTVAHNIARTETAVREMVERYEFVGKTVLSLGPRFGHEEYWMWRAGCPLLLIDIDEQHDILPILRSSPPGVGLRFVVGDAFEWSVRCEEAFEVLYTSGFGPLEIRRGEILQHSEWSAETEFYHPRVLHLCKRHLRPGGLYINQSYYAGPPLTPVVIEGMARQLDRAGLRLVEVHAWRNMPAIHLDVAVRCGNERLMERVSRMPPMSEIHGRSELPDRAVTRLFPSGAA
jgi:hypothetical protein